MKELLKQLAAYNVWANQKIIETLMLLPEEKILTDIPSSFKNIVNTVLHLLDAESIWWQRMKLLERINRPSSDFSGNFQEAAEALMKQSKMWQEWVSQSSEFSLDHVFQYLNRKGEPEKMQINQMLLHVFNHSTYHRGQIVNMLRQLGEKKIPSTDFATWVKTKK